MLAFLICCLVNDDTHGDVGDDAAQAVHQSRVTLAGNPQPFPPPASMDPFHQEVSIILMPIFIPQSLGGYGAFEAGLGEKTYSTEFSSRWQSNHYHEQ